MPDLKVSELPELPGEILASDVVLVVRGASTYKATNKARFLPPGGTTGQVAKRGAGSSVVWGEDNNTPGGGGGAVASVNGATGSVVVDKTSVGLPLADNTPDASKPVSGPMATALAAKANTSSLGSAAFANTTSFASTAQGAKADTALQPGGNLSSLNNDAEYVNANEVNDVINNAGLTAMNGVLPINPLYNKPLDGDTYYAPITAGNYGNIEAGLVVTDEELDQHTIIFHYINGSTPVEVIKRPRQAGAIPWLTTSLAFTPASDRVLWALEAGTYSNLNLFNGSAASSIVVTAPDITDNQFVYLVYILDNNMWSIQFKNPIVNLPEWSNTDYPAGRVVLRNGVMYKTDGGASGGQVPAEHNNWKPVYAENPNRYFKKEGYAGIGSLSTGNLAGVSITDCCIIIEAGIINPAGGGSFTGDVFVVNGRPIDYIIESSQAWIGSRVTTGGSVRCTNKKRDLIIINRPIVANASKGLVWSDQIKCLTGTIAPDNTNVNITYNGHANVMFYGIMVLARCLTPQEVYELYEDWKREKFIEDAVFYAPVERVTAGSVTDIINNITYTI